MQPAPPPPRSADGSGAVRTRHNPRPPASTKAELAQTPPRSVHRTYPPVGEDGAVVPVGGASAAAQLLNDPQAMHDVAFYQAVAEELPTSPVVHSVLYSHRSVVDDAPTCDEAFATVDKNLQVWRQAQEVQLNLSYEQTEQELQQEVREADKTAAEKELEYQRILERLETSVADLEGRVEKSLNEEDEQLRKSREDMMRRHKERDERTQQACAKLQTVTMERMDAQRELDLSTATAKLDINATLERGLLLSEEENLRIQLRFLSAHSKELIGVLEECVESREYWVQEELRERRQLDEWAVLVHERVKRAMRAHEIITSLLQHNVLSESGLRNNLEQDEYKEYTKMWIAFTGGPAAAQQIQEVEQLVYSSAGVESLDHPALSPSPTRSAESTEAIVEAFFRNFVDRSEESERLGFFISSKLEQTTFEGVEGAAALAREEEKQREEIAHWLANQTDRLLRQRRAHEIVTELVDHPVTKEHSQRLVYELEERRTRESIYAARREKLQQ